MFIVTLQTTFLLPPKKFASWLWQWRHWAGGITEWRLEIQIGLLGDSDRAASDSSLLLLCLCNFICVFTKDLLTDTVLGDLDANIVKESCLFEYNMYNTHCNHTVRALVVNMYGTVWKLSRECFIAWRDQSNPFGLLWACSRCSAFAWREKMFLAE